MTGPEVEQGVGRGLERLMANELDAADAHFQAVLAVFPDHAQATALRGAVAHRSGNLERACAFLEAAVALDPSAPDHPCNLAALLGELGRLHDAEKILRRALALRPAHVETRVNLGTVLLQSGRSEEALAHFDRVVALKPDVPQAHAQAAKALIALGRGVEALEALRRYRAFDPNDFDAAMQVAALWRDAAANPIESAKVFREAMALNPQAPIPRMELLFTLRQICAWDESAPLLAELVASRSCAELDGWVVPFFELSLPLSPARLRDDAAKHCRDLTGNIARPARPAVAALGHRRLRVGYVSGDFREHPLSHLMQGFFRHHDRNDVEVFVYSVGPDDGSTYRVRIEAAAEHFVDLAACSVEACVARIRADAIDVLVDLSGYTFLNRIQIFAHRPAPVQATYMGFAGTLGADFIDYQIVDRTIVPNTLAPLYTERLVYLPETYMVTDDEQTIDARPLTRADCGLPEEVVVFSCFNSPQKIEAEVFASWMRIVKRVEGSVLWLLAMAEPARENLRKFAADRGISADRLVFAPRWRKAPHLARLRLADLSLDTFYFGAHTTAVDALWAGLPVVTCPGETFASRVGASVLQAMGLPELIAKSREEYEALAVRLAENPEARAELRRRLAENRTKEPLFDTRRFTRHFERALHAMHDAQLAGDTSKAIDVPALPKRS